MQNRVKLAEAKLPEEVTRKGLDVRKMSSALIRVISLYSPNETYDGLFLSNYLTINLTDALARIPSVGQASQFGALDYSMLVWLDQTRLTNFGLTS